MLPAQVNAFNTLQFCKAIIPITRFNKGEAGKIIDEVKKEGARIIVKNNVPECVLISLEEYSELQEAAHRTARLDTSKKWDEKRKEFLKKARAHVTPPLPPSMSVEEALARYGSEPIDIDEEAINELRRISTL